MARLSILHYPDPRLRNQAQFVAAVDDSIRQLVADMFETMYEAPGIGLAAPQVGASVRVIVIDISDDKSQPVCLINPEIVDSVGSEEMEEGCLSVPSVYEKVTRAEKVTVRAQDQDGIWRQFEAEGLLAVCIQHEIDHLEGKLFVDYLSDLKRQRIRKKLEKHRRQTM